MPCRPAGAATGLTTPLHGLLVAAVDPDCRARCCTGRQLQLSTRGASLQPHVRPQLLRQQLQSPAALQSARHALPSTRLLHVMRVLVPSGSIPLIADLFPGAQGCRPHEAGRRGHAGESQGLACYYEGWRATVHLVVILQLLYCDHKGWAAGHAGGQLGVQFGAAGCIPCRAWLCKRMLPRVTCTTLCAIFGVQVDAKHVELHLDEEKPEGVVNEVCSCRANVWRACKAGLAKQAAHVCLREKKPEAVVNEVGSLMLRDALADGDSEAVACPRVRTSRWLRQHPARAPYTCTCWLGTLTEVHASGHPAWRPAAPTGWRDRLQNLAASSPMLRAEVLTACRPAWRPAAGLGADCVRGPHHPQQNRPGELVLCAGLSTAAAA